jgi:hypothetical protein
MRVNASLALVVAVLAFLVAAPLALLARRWLSVRSGAAVPGVSVNGGAPLDPELERRVDEELARFET